MRFLPLVTTRRLGLLAAAGGLFALLLAGSPAQGQEDDGSADAAGTSEDAAQDRQTQASRMTRGQQKLARALLARERALDRRERTLGDRQQDLVDAEAALQARIDEMSALRTDLEELLDRVEALEEERVTKLVGMVEKMRDKSAAAVLTETEPELAVKVLDRMKKQTAGAALAKMDPKKAADLAARLTRPIELPQGSR